MKEGEEKLSTTVKVYFAELAKSQVSRDERVHAYALLSNLASQLGGNARLDQYHQRSLVGMTLNLGNGVYMEAAKLPSTGTRCDCLWMRTRQNHIHTCVHIQYIYNT